MAAHHGVLEAKDHVGASCQKNILNGTLEDDISVSISDIPYRIVDPHTHHATQHPLGRLALVAG